ncbi:hypothetical protein H0E87_009406, partial [Populus deltoides]
MEVMAKLLSESDTNNKRFEFPTESLGAFPMPAGQNSVHFVAFDMLDKPWRLKISVRKKVYADESDGASVKLDVFQGARASNKGVSVLTKDTNSVAVFGSLKILSYNVWFRADLEMHRRMEAVGELIPLHSWIHQMSFVY